MNELDQIKELHDMLNIGLGFEKDLKKLGSTPRTNCARLAAKRPFSGLNEAVSRI